LLLNEKLSMCLYCKHFSISNRAICPTDAEIPHLCGDCWNSPHEDAYNKIPADKHNPIWINLLTMETWVDGSVSIPNKCSNFEFSPLIKKPNAFGLPA